MIQYLYLFQDSVSGNYGKPFFAPNAEAIKRDFLTSAADPTIPEWYLTDCICLEFGTFDFDAVNPHFVLYDVPRVVLRGSDHEIMALRRAACPASDGDSI